MAHRVVGVEFERPGWDEYFMLQAELAKLRSNCMAKSVGAVIVQNNRQLATGYNGTPPGAKNCHEGGCPRCIDRMDGKIKSGEGLERCLCNHAEANAIMHCAILGISTGASNVSLYSTMTPCLECTKMAVTIGVKRIVCLEKYAETDMGLARDSGIEIVHLDKTHVGYWIKKLAYKYTEIDRNYATLLKRLIAMPFMSNIESSKIMTTPTSIDAYLKAYQKTHQITCQDIIDLNMSFKGPISKYSITENMVTTSRY